MSLICTKCLKNIPERQHLTCVKCQKNFDIECANISSTRYYGTMDRTNWECYQCIAKRKMQKSIETPTYQLAGRPQRQIFPSRKVIEAAASSRQVTTLSENTNKTPRRQKRQKKPQNILDTSSPVMTSSDEDIEALGDTQGLDNTISCQKTPSNTQTSPTITIDQIEALLDRKFEDIKSSMLNELKCCGITDARNYDMSIWQLRRLGPRGLSVPPSCCVQLEGASYLNPAPVNSSRCQEITPNPDFRYVPGCLDKLEDWYQQQYLVLMLGLFITALFKLAILLSTVFSCILLKKRRQVIHSITMRTIDNDRNENIYENKMPSMHDDPITTKYIQPNNFYTPRARNPRIFPNKPNEMV